jgi:DNA-binding HxlR family transcriptional regulator
MSQRNTGVTVQTVNAHACPVREVLDRVSGKWSVQILVAAAHGPIRFTELERSIEGTWSATASSPARSMPRCRRRWSTN